MEEPERLVISPEMRQCIEATSDCYKICSETLSHSLEGGSFWNPRQLRALIDCCEVLQATENALLRGSSLSIMLAAVCVEACESVAESCRLLDGSDEMLAACAETCDETADCCRQLAV